MWESVHARYTSAGHTYCYRGRVLPSASEEVQEHFLQNAIQNLDLIPNTEPVVVIA